MKAHRLVLLDVVPFRVNKAYYKGSFNMTTECRLWRKTIVRALKQAGNQSVMDNFRDFYNEWSDLYSVGISISFGIKSDRFFNNAGKISARSFDLTNIEKLLVDILFDERFFERKEIRNLNINDKYIVRLRSEKIPTNRSKIVVDLYLIETPIM